MKQSKREQEVSVPASTTTTMSQDLSLSWEKPTTNRTNQLNSTFVESTRKASTISNIPPIIEHRVNSKKHRNYLKRVQKRRSKMEKLVNESTFLQETFDGISPFDQTGDLGGGVYEVENVSILVNSPHLGLIKWKGYTEKTVQPIENLKAHAPVVYNKGVEKHNTNPQKLYEIRKVKEPTKIEINEKAAAKKFKRKFCLRLFTHEIRLAKHLLVHN